MDTTRCIRITAISVDPAAHAVETAAAHELRDYLGRMGGGQLPVLAPNDPALPGAGVVFVGGSDTAVRRGLCQAGELASLAADAFVVRSRDGQVLAAGGGYRGTVYAVYRLLEHLGCRFYHEELEIVPDQGDCRIPATLELADSPAFEWRAMWGTVPTLKAALSPGEWPAAIQDIELPKMMAIPQGGFWHHTLGFLLPASDQPPEYLAMLGGERRVVDPARQQYCLSNPGFLRLATEAALRWMDEDTDPVYYPIHYGDVGNFCECDSCRAMYAEQGSITDAVIGFLNHIAAEAETRHPEKFLTILAYWGTRNPPVRQRPRANLLIVFCAISECQARPWSHPVNQRLHVCRDLERWIELHPLGPQGIITFEYPTTYYFAGYPYPALYAHAENLRYYRRLGLRGVYICGLTRGHLLPLYSYVISRLLWNPERDPGALIDEFSRAWYGPAAEPMGQYVDLLHRSATASSSQGVMDCHAGPGQLFFRELWTRELLDQAEELLSRAEDAADTPAVRQRVAGEYWGLLFTDLYLHAASARNLTPDTSPRGYSTAAPTEADYRRMATLLRLCQELERPWDVEKRRQYSLTAIVGFEPTATPWWTCPRVQQLMEDPRRVWEEDVRQHADRLARHVAVLENEHTQVVLIPALGGRIWRLYAQAAGVDLLRREPVPWHLLEGGAHSTTHVEIGGYEEYAGELYGAPGWAEWYACTVTPDGDSATLTAQVDGGLELRRIVRLLATEPGIEVESRLTNSGDATRQGVVLRAHPEFVLDGVADEPVLLVRQADGIWAERAPVSETWLSGPDLPAGAWGLVDRTRNVGVIDEFDLDQVKRCYLYIRGDGSAYNLELFSVKRDLHPGEWLELRHRYALRHGPWLERT